jgi:hypothetical protein
MGDTEAILAGLNTQGEQETVCDKSKAVNIDPDETVGPDNNVSKGNDSVTEQSKSDVTHTEKDIVPIEIDEDENEHDEDQAVNNVDNDDDDDEVIIVNKNLEGAKQETKKPETPPLTRCKFNTVFIKQFKAYIYYHLTKVWRKHECTDFLWKTHIIKNTAYLKNFLKFT